MRPIDPIVLNQLQQLQYIPALLTYIGFPSGLDARYTTWSSDLDYQSNTYYSRGMEFSSINFGGGAIVDGTTFAFNDVDREIYNILKSMNIKNDIVISVSLAVLNTSSHAIMSSSIIWDGFIGSWDYAPGRTSIKAVSILDKWQNMSTAKFSGSCRWKIFKGLECQYSGSGTSCDRSLWQCIRYGNDDRFGGFPWITNIQNTVTGASANDRKDK